MKTLKLKVVTYFSSETHEMKQEEIDKFNATCDKDDDIFGGDYSGVDIYKGDELVAEYGDYYHDKGAEKAEAFIEGLEWAGYEVEIESLNHLRNY